MEPYKKNCKICQSSYKTTDREAMYCSPACKQKAYRKRISKKYHAALRQIAKLQTA